jgi:hypothetical protein
MSNDFKAQLEATIRKFGDDAGTVRGAAVNAPALSSLLPPLRILNIRMC